MAEIEHRLPAFAALQREIAETKALVAASHALLAECERELDISWDQCQQLRDGTAEIVVRARSTLSADKPAK